MRIAKTESGDVLKLSGELRISVAEELRAALLDLVCTASRPIVDLSEVTQCDITGLQLLISAGRTAERSAKPFELVRMPAAVREAREALGLPMPQGAPERGFENGI